MIQKLDNCGLTEIVFLVSATGRDSAAKLQVAGRVVQERLSGSEDAETASQRAVGIADRMHAVNRERLLPKIALLPIRGGV